MEYCNGGELYDLLLKQPNMRFVEAHSRFYVAEARAAPALQLRAFVHGCTPPHPTACSRATAAAGGHSRGA